MIVVVKDSSLDVFMENMIGGMGEDLGFLVVQVVVICVAIFVVGGKAGELIIKREVNTFLIGFLSLLLLWLILFISSATTSAIINSFTYGLNGFLSAFESWIIYGLVLFLVLGVANGLTLGFFLGIEIKRKGGPFS